MNDLFCRRRTFVMVCLDDFSHVFLRDEREREREGGKVKQEKDCEHFMLHHLFPHIPSIGRCPLRPTPHHAPHPHWIHKLPQLGQV